MTASVSDLGARVLRRLGLGLTALSGRPAVGPSVPLATVAARALRTYGVLVPEAERPAPGAPLTREVVAAIALKKLGINLVNGSVYDPTPMPALEVARRALVRLEVIAGDEIPSVTDSDLAYTEVAAVQGILAAEGVVPWTLDTIPRFAGELIAVMAAGMLASSFGKPIDFTGGFEWARKELRTIAVSFSNGQAIAQAEVITVTQSLAERGFGWWDDNAIPASVSGDLAILVAARIAPVFGAPFGMDTAASAETAIRQAALFRGATQRAEAAVRSAYAELSASGMADFGLDAIPPGVAEGLEALAVQAMAGDFEKTADPNAVQAAEARLRRIILSGAVGQAIAEQHLWDVHADLDSRGRTRWTMNDIPDAACFPYVLLAANRMAPEAGVQANPADVVEAEIRLNRIVAMPSSGDRITAEYY